MKKKAKKSEDYGPRRSSEVIAQEIHKLREAAEHLASELYGLEDEITRDGKDWSVIDLSKDETSFTPHVCLHSNKNGELCFSITVYDFAGMPEEICVPVNEYFFLDTFSAWGEDYTPSKTEKKRIVRDVREFISLLQDHLERVEKVWDGQGQFDRPAPKK